MAACCEPQVGRPAWYNALAWTAWTRVPGPPGAPPPAALATDADAIGCQPGGSCLGPRGTAWPGLARLRGAMAARCRNQPGGARPRLYRRPPHRRSSPCSLPFHFLTPRKPHFARFASAGRENSVLENGEGRRAGGRTHGTRPSRPALAAGCRGRGRGGSDATRRNGARFPIMFSMDYRAAGLSGHVGQLPHAAASERETNDIDNSKRLLQKYHLFKKFYSRKKKVEIVKPIAHIFCCFFPLKNKIKLPHMIQNQFPIKNIKAKKQKTKNFLKKGFLWNFPNGRDAGVLYTALGPRTRTARRRGADRRLRPAAASSETSSRMAVRSS